jgi:hypothetical protein
MDLAAKTGEGHASTSGTNDTSTPTIPRDEFNVISTLPTKNILMHKIDSAFSGEYKMQDLCIGLSALFVLAAVANFTRVYLLTTAGRVFLFFLFFEFFFAFSRRAGDKQASYASVFFDSPSRNGVFRSQ